MQSSFSGFLHHLLFFWTVPTLASNNTAPRSSYKINGKLFGKKKNRARTTLFFWPTSLSRRYFFFTKYLLFIRWGVILRRRLDIWYLGVGISQLRKYLYTLDDFLVRVTRLHCARKFYRRLPICRRLRDVGASTKSTKIRRYTCNFDNFSFRSTRMER